MRRKRKRQRPRRLRRARGRGVERLHSRSIISPLTSCRIDSKKTGATGRAIAPGGYGGGLPLTNERRGEVVERVAQAFAELDDIVGNARHPIVRFGDVG